MKMVKSIPFERSFASHPKAKYLSDKNTINPAEITGYSEIELIFDCKKCFHEFVSRVANISRGCWCPYCSSIKLCNDRGCEKCYEKSLESYEETNKRYRSCDNQGLDSRFVFKSSGKIYNFYCPICLHLSEIRAADFSNGQYCSYCSGKKLCKNSKCQFCKLRSFESCEKSKFWSTKNKIEPRNIFKATPKKYIFDCPNCFHEFSTSPNFISAGYWCPYCASIRLCENKECDFCFKKSLASREGVVKEWSEKNKIQPRNVFKNSRKKYVLICYTCKHEYNYTPSANKTCSFCSNKRLCSDLSCKICSDKSFASIERSNFWSKKNKIEPRLVFKYSMMKFYFNCEVCSREFLTTPGHVCEGRWCPFCKKKTEGILKEALERYKPEYQKCFDWCINPETGCKLSFDFYIKESRTIIELDGDQHFKQIGSWTSPQLTRERDHFKMKLAYERGYTIIRVLQTDVWLNKNQTFSKKKSFRLNWKEKIMALLSTMTVRISCNTYEPHIIYLYKGKKLNFHVQDQSYATFHYF